MALLLPFFLVLACFAFAGWWRGSSLAAFLFLTALVSSFVHLFGVRRAFLGSVGGWWWASAGWDWSPGYFFVFAICLL